MRKKTTKFYLFKPTYQYPMQQYNFYFSKRTFKQRRYNLNHRLYKNWKRWRLKINFYVSLEQKLRLKRYTHTFEKRFFKYQHAASRSNLRILYLRSYFLSKLRKLKRSKNKHKKRRQLYAFWLFKHRFYLNLKRARLRYMRAGFLSSQYVQVFSRKNQYYAASKKYKARLFEMADFLSYVYRSINKIFLYVKYNFTDIFFFTTNVTTRFTYVDHNLHPQWTTWGSGFANYSKYSVSNLWGEFHFKKQFTINWELYTAAPLALFINNRQQLIDYFKELDSKTKTLKFESLITRFNSQFFDIAPTVYTLFFFKDVQPIYTNPQIIYMLKEYTRLYNEWPE